MVDKLLAAFAMATLVAFVMIVVVYVNEPELWIVTLLVLAMAIHDFVQSFRKNGGSANS